MRRLVLFIIVPMLVLSVAAFIVSFWVIEESRDIPIDLQVDSILGFNLDADGIHMGRLLSPGGGSRAIDVTNPVDHARYARIYISGNISGFVEADSTAFRLAPEGTKRITFNAKILQALRLGIILGL